MAARRCSMCGVNWGLGIHRCPQCDGELWYGSDLEISDKGEDAGGMPLVGAQRGDAEGWRAEMIEERCGFTAQQAAVLARTRTASGFFVDWQWLQRATAGCDDEQRAIVFDALTLNA